MTRRTAPRVEMRMRLAADGVEPIGPGKVALLESIGSTGSISSAARAHGMSYTRAWKLVAEINAAFAAPLVLTATGGAAGGGAVLSEPALRLIALYRETEAEVEATAAARLASVLGAIAKPRRGR